MKNSDVAVGMVLTYAINFFGEEFARMQALENTKSKSDHAEAKRIRSNLRRRQNNTSLTVIRPEPSGWVVNDGKSQFMIFASLLQRKD